MQDVGLMFAVSQYSFLKRHNCFRLWRSRFNLLASVRFATRLHPWVPPKVIRDRQSTR
jgi:hypothetical protein